MCVVGQERSGGQPADPAGDDVGALLADARGRQGEQPPFEV